MRGLLFNFVFLGAVAAYFAIVYGVPFLAEHIGHRRKIIGKAYRKRAAIQGK